MEPNVKTGSIDSEAWDFEAVLRRVNRKEERIRKLVDIFLRDMPPRIADLSKAIEKKDNIIIQATAHTIKGVAANLSIGRLAKHAQAIEAQAKENDLGSVPDHFLKLEEAYLEIKNILEDYLSQAAR